MSAFRFFLFCAAFAIVFPCGAQTTYRWTSATGEIIFSDQPPPTDVRVFEKTEGRESEQPLSYATRVAAEKYPVTLYTTANCKEVCVKARTLLNGRGVPFAEKLFTTAEEVAEVAESMGKEMVIPSLRVGAQNFPGFESGAWNNLLDLAGYPKTAPLGSKPSGAFAK
ncbi:MAG: glutaredoxin family protein [Candidatus Accumulibacter sp.]|nr:glutaredoxin family protein [Accumulibacter sp.]